MMGDRDYHDIENNYYLPTSSYLTSVHCPKELHTVLLDLYLCVLENSPKNVVDYSCKYFKKMKSLCGGAKISFTGTDVCKMEHINPSVLQKRRGAVSADHYESEFTEKLQNILRTATDCKLKRITYSIPENDFSSAIACSVRSSGSKSSISICRDMSLQNFIASKRDTLDIENKQTDDKCYNEISLTGGTSKKETLPERISDRRLKLTNEDVNNLRDALKKHPIFKYLDPKAKRKVAMSFSPILTQKQHFVFLEGEDADKCYFVDTGDYAEYKEGENENGLFIRSFSSGTLFGDLAFFYKHKRTSSVLVRNEGRLLLLDRSEFRNLVLNEQFSTYLHCITILEGIYIFQTMSPTERSLLSEIAEFRTYNNELLFSSSEISDGLYLVLEGVVDIYVHDQFSHANPSIKAIALEKITMGTVEVGGYFGDFSLVADCIRIAFAKARGSVKVCFVPVRDFRNYFKRYLTFTKNSIPIYEMVMANQPLYKQVDAPRFKYRTLNKGIPKKLTDSKSKRGCL